MDKNYRIVVFGKAGCPKCKTLNSRLDKLLVKDDWKQFEKEYCDIETIDGLLRFSRSECINPNRIPALLILQKDEESGEFRPMMNPAPETEDQVCKNSKLYTYLGLQTDYTDIGKGLITPKMLTAVLQQAAGL